MEEKTKSYSFYKVIMLIILAVIITFLITSISVYKYLTNEGNLYNIDSTSSDIESTLSKFRGLIDKYYLGEVDENALIEGAIAGYISGLGDIYTEYIPASEMEEYTEELMGSFVGIGIYMIADEEANKIQIISPIKDSPAEEAGLQPGDYIISVDGVECTAEDMTQVASDIKGEEGTIVKLGILRENETFEVEITRASVDTNPIVGEVLENNIGYIEFSSVDEDASEKFKETYQNLKNQGIESLIIDLRNNTGGLVEEALKIAELIVDKGSTLLITTDKEGNEEITVSEEDPIIDVPIVVLVNENSASAAEILAGALQDLDKATLVGTTTYGKGVIQVFLTLNDGSGLKITTSEYYTPNRSKINEVGIEPDEVVELSEDIENILLVEKSEDTQLQKAIEILNN